MKYFKDAEGQVWGVGDNQSHIIKSDWVETDKPEFELSAKDKLRLGLATLRHDFGDGRVIQVRQGADESNIRNAIERMDRLETTSEEWLMADNIFYSVTKDELIEALKSGQDQVAELWEEFKDSL